jgi:glycosyltransferase involved in cell wall biosynthesis
MANAPRFSGSHVAEGNGGNQGRNNAAGIRLVHIMTVPLTLTFFRGQVGFMERRGFDVRLICGPGKEVEEFMARERVPVSTVPMHRRITPFRDLVALGRIYLQLRRLQPTVVHTHTPKASLLGMIAAWLLRRPLRIYHLRGLRYIAAVGFRRRLLQWMERLTCSFADQVLCVSRSIRETAVADGVCPAEKISVLLSGSGQGVDTQRFSPANLPEGTREEIRRSYGIPLDAVVIGFIGRIVRDKGAVELAEAWGDLRNEYPGAHLLIVGPFESEDPVPAGVEEFLRQDPRVHLAGLEWDTPPLYAAMDVVALPTYREGFPNVPLEAAAMRLPMVATRVPGCVDAIQDGVTGTLVPPRDAGSLAGAIRRYLEDPELRAQHGHAGRERVLREFRREAIWEALYQEYCRLLRERGLSVPGPITNREPIGLSSFG